MNPGDLPLLLVIDDDPDQLALVRVAALRAGGLRVISAESGAEALIQLQARAAMRLPQPDLVLTDLKMPDMNGLDLMNALRQRPDVQSVPVLFLTSSNYNRDRIVAHMAGAGGFFQKPMRFADLIAIMKALPAFVRHTPDHEPAPSADAQTSSGVRSCAR